MGGAAPQGEPRKQSFVSLPRGLSGSIRTPSRRLGQETRSMDVAKETDAPSGFPRSTNHANRMRKDT